MYIFTLLLFFTTIIVKRISNHNCFIIYIRSIKYLIILNTFKHNKENLQISFKYSIICSFCFITGLPHTQGIQGNSGNFQVEENIRETQRD